MRVAKALCDRGPNNVSVHVLTDLSRDNMLSGATDVGGLVDLCDALPQTEIRFLPSLHAKVYVADERCAIVTSANLTDNGLSRNFEYGIAFSQRSVVRRVRTHILEYSALGSLVQKEQLKHFRQIIDDLKDIRNKAMRSLQARLRRQFDQKTETVDQEIFRFRAESVSAHAAFADAILYVLKRSPQDTRAIYTEIQKIHPDLCDDSVKLRIKGQEWSQVKWHHRVRHAQLQLKRQGRIRRDGGKWYVIQ